MVPKPMAPIDREHVETEHVKKCCFSCVKLSFFMLARSCFFEQILNEWQAFWKFLSSYFLRSGRFRISRGGPRAQKGALCCPKGVLEGYFWELKGVKVIIGDQNCIFKIVEKSLVFIAFLSR